MRLHGKTRLGFFPLPLPEAQRLKKCLTSASAFSALDPCVGDGAAFTGLLHDVTAHRYGIEIDANRAEQAQALGSETLQANAMDVRCPPEAVSLLYLNPPYDWEIGESNNQRLELVFLEHSYRWLKAGGVLVFVIPQLRLAKCARLLSEHFTDLRVFRLTEPDCLEYKQIVVLATRLKRHSKVSDAVLLDGVLYLEALATKSELEPLGDNPEVRYEVPASEQIVLTNMGIPLDEVEDLLLESAAYRLAVSVLFLRAYEGVSFAEAVERTKYDLRWKVALGLEMEEVPMQKSALQEFEAKLVLHEMEEPLLKKSIAEARRAGYLKNRKLRVALDTTPILGKGAVKDTYNLLGEGIEMLGRRLAEVEKEEVTAWAEKQVLSRYYW